MIRPAKPIQELIPFAARLALLTALFLVTLPVPATAADSDTGARTAGTDDAFGPQTDADRLLADRLVLAAINALKGIENPSEQQIVSATLLMDMALQLNPDEPGTWLLSEELARIADNDQAVENALKRYIRLVPEDDAAQLRLIELRSQRIHTLPDRVAMFERILNSRNASRLSKPLRSRLATAAAAASLEMGDPKRHLTHLRSAVKLDPANPDAASMTYQYVLQRNGTPLQVGAMLINLIKTMPGDPDVRLEFAKTLADAAAFEQAAQQSEVAARLLPRPLTINQYHRWVLSLAASGQDEKALGLIQELEQIIQASPADQRSQDAADLPQLPLDFQLIRLAILDGPDDTEAAQQQFQVISDIILAQSENAQNRAGLALVAASFDVSLDQTNTLLEGVPDDLRNSQLARGWLALRIGDTDQARALLEPLAQSEPSAQLALAELAEQTEAGNLRALLKVVHDQPTQIVSLLAARSLLRSERSVSPTSIGLALVEKMERQPNTLWRFDPAENRWTVLRTEIRPLRIGFAEPVNMRVTIQNRAEFPLAIGQDAPLSSRLVVTVESSVSGQTLSGNFQPTFAQAGRRLTLQPGDQFSFNIRLDRGSFSRAIDQFAFAPLSFSTKAFLDPRSTPSGATISGPLGASTRTRVNQVWGKIASTENITRWIEQLQSNDQTERLQALGTLAMAGSPRHNAEISDEDRQRIADALVQNYKNLHPNAQAWMLFYLAARDGEQDPAQPILDLAKRSDHPATRIAFLLTQVNDPQSPEIAAALRHGDRTIRDFAAAYQINLTEAQEPTSP